MEPVFAGYLVPISETKLTELKVKSQSVEH